MKPYSTDLRPRVVEALQDGQTQPAVARRFALSLSSVQCYAQKWRHKEDLAPRPVPGRARLLTPAQQQELGTLVQERTNWTLQSLTQAWQQYSGQTISVATLHRCLQRGGYSYEKRAVAAERDPQSGDDSDKK